jgi:uncharacterized repeat protein (TIGR03803 family)
MLHVRQRICQIAIFCALASLPIAAVRRPDTGNSANGSFGNCNGGGTCAYLGAQGTATLSGIDQGGHAVTVAITLYNWGHYPCGTTSCTPVVNSTVLDVVLTGTDIVSMESLVVKGTLSNPSYVSCAGENGDSGIACILSPEPDGQNVQQPTAIAGADHGANTRWDFGGVPPANPPLPAIPFDQLVCSQDDGPDKICGTSRLGETILTVANSVAANKLGTSAGDYRVTLTDGTQLGTLAVPAAPKKHAANNTLATATVIKTTAFNDHIDTSQAYPGINADGSMNYPQGFTLAPVPPASSSSFPSCYPADTRTFRTVWYTYAVPSNGSISINTAGSRYDTLVYVFTGSTAQPTTVACDDDPPNSSLLQSSISFNVKQGTRYYMVVMESPPEQVNFQGTLTGYPLSVDGTLSFNFSFSTSTVKTITTTTIASFPNPSLLGNPVTLTAKVIPFGTGTPTGTVTFNDGTTVLGTASLSGNTATISTSVLPKGTDSITATYNGDSNFYSSTSEALTQGVAAPTTTTLTTSPNPSKPSQRVSLKASVTAASGMATGTVQFLLPDGTALGTSPLHAGVASLTTTALPLGFTSLTASYLGDASDNPSTSNGVNQYVGLNPLTILYSFKGGADGGVPEANLLRDSQGNFYSTTVYGGSNNAGTVFEIDATGRESVLHSFTGTGGDGAYPYGSLLHDTPGNLYGTTSAGGAACPAPNSHGCGTVFELSPPSGGVGPWTETVLYSFTGTAGDGAFPMARLVRDPATGNLYGTTYSGGNLNCPIPYSYGCGTVFELSPPGTGSSRWTEKIIYTFTGGADGALPQSRLVFDSASDLYGTAYEGGIDCPIPDSYGCGTVFELSPPGGGNGPWTESVLYSFTGTSGDGANPMASVILSSGNLYGTTNEGGDSSCVLSYQLSGCGTVFELSPPAGSAGPWSEKILYSFTGTGLNGAYPQANLIRDSNGSMYGTTAYGGAAGDGTVFEISPTGVESSLCNFTGSGGDGSIPVSGVVQDSQGNLYGTTFNGGASNYGTVYKLKP